MKKRITAVWLLAAAVFYLAYLRGNWLRKRIAQCGMEPESI